MKPSTTCRLSFGRPSCKKTVPFLSAFPMFVPSLSWQSEHFYIQMAQKDRFLTLWNGQDMSDLSPTVLRTRQPDRRDVRESLDAAGQVRRKSQSGQCRAIQGNTGQASLSSAAHSPSRIKSAAKMTGPNATVPASSRGSRTINPRPSSGSSLSLIEPGKIAQNASRKRAKVKTM